MITKECDIKRAALEIRRAGRGGYIITDARLHADAMPYLHFACSTLEEALNFIRTAMADEA